MVHKFKVKKHDIDSSSQDKVTIGENDLGISHKDTKIICNYCSQVVTVRLSDDEWFCNNCSITIIPSIQDVRRVQDLEVPQGVNDEILICHPPEPHEEDVRIKKEPDLQGGFKALRDKGLRVTDYHESLP